MNICFASEKTRLKKTVLKNTVGFREVFAPLPDNVDILVVSGSCDLSEYLDRNIDTCIFDSESTITVSKLKNVNSAISCGMQGLDSVTFSSISEDSALVCIRRCIVFGDSVIYPCEFKTRFDYRLGIFQNLVVALVELFVNQKTEKYER